jgi:hypothetical protein
MNDCGKFSYHQDTAKSKTNSCKTKKSKEVMQETVDEDYSLQPSISLTE